MSSTIQQVKSKYQQTWLQQPDVVSVGIGMTEDKQPAIIVGVTSDTSVKFPPEIDGFPVLIQKQGQIRAR